MDPVGSKREKAHLYQRSLTSASWSGGALTSASSGVDPVGSEKASASVSALSVKRILPDQWIRHRVDPFSWDPASRFREKSTGSRSIIEWEWIRHHGMGVDPVGSEKASLGENGL